MLSDRKIYEVEIQEGGGIPVPEFTELCNGLTSLKPGKYRIVAFPEKVCGCGDIFYGSGKECWICASTHPDEMEMPVTRKEPRPLEDVLDALTSNDPFAPLGDVEKKYTEGWKAGVKWSRPDALEVLEDRVRCVHCSKNGKPYGDCDLKHGRCTFLLYEQVGCPEYARAGPAEGGL